MWLKATQTYYYISLKVISGEMSLKGLKLRGQQNCFPPGGSEGEPLL